MCKLITAYILTCNSCNTGTGRKTGNKFRANAALHRRDDVASGEKTEGSASITPRSNEGRAPYSEDLRSVKNVTHTETKRERESER